MERVRHFNAFMYDFGRSVVEWRSPATAPYLMLINTAFWATAFYCDPGIQLKVLVSLAAGVFGWDVLLSPTYDRNIATHVFMWPVQSLWRTFGVALSLYSAHSLHFGDTEKACWTAYSTVGCLLVNPVWTYYDTNQKIMNGVSYASKKTGDAANTVIVRPVCAVYRVIKYVVLLEFVPPMWAAIKHSFSQTGGGIKGFFRLIWRGICRGCVAVKDWWRHSVVEPIYNTCCSIGRWLRYWFCAHWWPDLKEWLKIKVGRPMQRLFNYICYGLVYVFCGHWIKPLCRFVWRHLQRLGGFLHRTVWTPTKLWLLARLRDLVALTRRLLHRAAVAIRDSVLWPICVLLGDCAKEIYLMIHKTCIQPVWDYLYGKYKCVEDAAIIHVLGPVCETVINNIPEKSPFCEESDVELEGMLPDEISEAAELESVGGQEGVESADDFALSPIPLDEEEREFASGLHFPTIIASESSDEEFDLQNKEKGRTHLRQRRHKKKPVEQPEVESDTESRLRSRRNNSDEIKEDDLLPHHRSDVDDHFELLG